MANLRVDTGAVRRTQSTFSGIKERLEEAVDGFSGVSGATVGHEDLRARPDDLGSSWGIGLKKLGEYAEVATEALSGVAESFEQADEELAKAFDGEGDIQNQGGAQ